RQGDLCSLAQRRVATCEDQTQAFVAHDTFLDWVIDDLRYVELRVAGIAERIAPNTVDGAVARGRDDPSRGTWRTTGRRPPLDRGREGVLDSFFGEIDVAEGAHQHGHGAAVLLAE